MRELNSLKKCQTEFLFHYIKLILKRHVFVWKYIPFIHVVLNAAYLYFPIDFARKFFLFEDLFNYTVPTLFHVLYVWAAQASKTSTHPITPDHLRIELTTPCNVPLKNI